VATSLEITGRVDPAPVLVSWLLGCGPIMIRIRQGNQRDKVVPKGRAKGMPMGSLPPSGFLSGSRMNSFIISSTPHRQGWVGA